MQKLIQAIQRRHPIRIRQRQTIEHIVDEIVHRSKNHLKTKTVPGTVILSTENKPSQGRFISNLSDFSRLFLDEWRRRSLNAQPIQATGSTLTSSFYTEKSAV
jgi:hypothetical protein